MKTVFLLLSISVSLLCSARAGDPTKSDSVETRLQAVESQLDRIEALLQAPPTAVTVVPDVPAGRMRVTVIGQVVRPGVFIVSADMPLTTLIALAHGFTRIASIQGVSVASQDGTIVKIDMKASSQPYKLKADDIITVPERFF